MVTGIRNVTGYWALASGATLQRHIDSDVILIIYIYGVSQENSQPVSTKGIQL